jgi:hypothetical protein
MPCRHRWRCLLAFLLEGDLSPSLLDALRLRRIQIWLL